MAHDSQPDRTWRKIATEASTERNSEKIAELIDELIHALDEDARQRSRTDRGK